MTTLLFDECSLTTQRHLEEALLAARKSDMYHKIGSAVVSGGTCLTSACNSTRSRFDGKMHCSYHAEMAALSQLRVVHA